MSETAETAETAEAAPEVAYEGVIVIEWPAARRKPATGSPVVLPAWPTAVFDAATGELIQASQVDVHVEHSSWITADLTVFTDPDGRPLGKSDTTVYKDEDGKFRTATFRYLVAEMRVRPARLAQAGNLTSAGQVAYEAYVASCGGKSVHGEDLPSWAGLAPAIQAHWEAAAQAVAGMPEPAGP